MEYIGSLFKDCTLDNVIYANNYLIKGIFDGQEVDLQATFASRFLAFYYADYPCTPSGTTLWSCLSKSILGMRVPWDTFWEMLPLS